MGWVFFAQFLGHTIWRGGMSWLDVSPSQHFSRYPKCGVSVALLSPHTVTSGALRKVCKIRP